MLRVQVTTSSGQRFQLTGSYTSNNNTLVVYPGTGQGAIQFLNIKGVWQNSQCSLTAKVLY